MQALKKQVTRLDDLKKTLMASLSDVEQQAVEDASSILMSEDYLRSAVPLTAASVSGPAYATQPQQPASRGAFGNAPASGGLGLPTAAAGGEGSPGGNQGVDGKQFFRNARARLSYY